jgi:hypothetical protein
MADAEWDATDMVRMITHLRDLGSHRRLRLFACACVRHVWHLLQDERSRRAVETAERYADGLATEEELRSAGAAAGEASREALARAPESVTGPWFAANAALNTCNRSAVSAVLGAVSDVCFATMPRNGPPGADPTNASRAQLAALCDICGNPLRRVALPPSALRWNGGTVVQLARRIYEERRFEDLPVLADALEEAGCTDAVLLDHCRAGAGHVPGCWAVDLVLGRT